EESTRGERPHELKCESSQKSNGVLSGGVWRMSMTTKLTLSCLGAFLGPVAMYYQSNATPVNIQTAAFWISAMFAGIMPLATYFVGLAQRSPWDAPTLPTSIVETKRTVTDPAPVTAPPVVS